MDGTQPAGAHPAQRVDVTAVTWHDRRKGWMGRPPARAPVAPPAAPAMPDVADASVLIVPKFPAFSPAAIAGLVHQSRQLVYYWMTSGKLESFRDNIGEPYVLRAELIRFLREYLGKDVS